MCHYEAAETGPAAGTAAEEMQRERVAEARSGMEMRKLVPLEDLEEQNIAGVVQKPDCHHKVVDRSVSQTLVAAVDNVADHTVGDTADILGCQEVRSSDQGAGHILVSQP